MATAIYVKTESSDSYLWANENNLSEAEVKALLKERMDDEYDYIADIEVALSNGTTLDVNVWED